MVTMTVVNRVFFVQYGNGSGTAFTLDVDNRQYLITARHVVEGMADHDVISIQRSSKWEQISVKPIWCDPPSADIVVLCADSQLSATAYLEPTCGGIMLSQDVYFLGFPYGLFGNPDMLSGSLPIPLVKKGILSGMSKTPDDVMNLILDGHNNPGFSGGPIVFSAPGKFNKEPKIAGVISGFRGQEEPVLHQGQPTPLTWVYNTGIVIGCDIKHAVDAIKSRPEGFPLPQK